MSLEFSGPLRWLGWHVARRIALTWIGVSIAVCGCVQKSPESADESESSAITPLEVTSNSGIAQIALPGGTFLMGSGEGDEGPRHEVTVSPFVIDQYEVQQQELAKLQWPDASHFKDPQRPVEMIRWSEAAMVCNERSRREGLDPCYDDLDFTCDFSANGYRLPTEAEWEYAARAGSTAAFPPGKEVEKLMARACYAGNSSEQTERVGQLRPNAWGLYDMLGNVAEWCHDIYGEDYYANSPAVDPTGAEAGAKRVLRGGAWDSEGAMCRPTSRLADDPGIDDACFAQDRYGFRMVRRPSADERQRLEGGGESGTAP